MNELRTYLDDVVRTFRKSKALAEGALAQMSDDDLRRAIDPDANSVATLMQHLSGNLRSRFTDFLTTDGEKPDRDRDTEFTANELSRDALLSRWQAAWEVTLAAIAGLEPHDLARTVHIRGEAFAVVEALNRAATHTSYHVGQIVLLAKHFAGPEWRSLSIPKGQSANYAVGKYKQQAPPT
ncbi:MAG: DUF1572 domain-containing protein [Luteitalea sp.]|nr:DUF1572 domain-containing protein [Luteitalea sp.]